MTKFSSTTQVIALISILALFFTRLLFFDFANYDDNIYVTNNEFIKKFSLENIQYIFSHQFFGHYFPITLFSYSIEHFFFGLNPSIFHFTNVFFHLLNTLLVYYLLKELKFLNFSCLLGALIFSIHPMQLESVVWIGARNNILFGFFFISGLITYFNFLGDESKKTNLIFTFLLFILSGLSKSSAVVFPVVLLLIDWLKSRKITIALFLEKLPFFLGAACFSYVASNAANSFGSVESIYLKYSLFQQPFLISYPISVYTAKFFIPLFLKINYANPELVNGLLPWFYYASFATIIIILVLLAYLLKAKKKVVLFGLIFFLVNISLYLKIFFSTNIILAERYAYIAYLGLIILPLPLVEFVNLKGKEKSSKILNISLLAWLLFLGISTQFRMNVWKNGQVLFTDLISNNEKASSYLFRGTDLYQQGKLDEALIDLNKAVSLDSTKATIFNARGYLYVLREEPALAKQDFYMALKLDSTFGYAYFNLGKVYISEENYKKAKLNFLKNLDLEPNHQEAIFQLGNIAVTEKKYDKALAYFTKVITLNPEFMEAYNNRGFVYMILGEKANACSDWIAASGLGNENASLRIRKYCN
jgi:protein O-mannosyl-transferase